MHEFAYAKRYYCLMKYVNLASAKKTNIKMHEHIGDAPRLNSASCRAPLCQPPRSYGHSLYGCAIAASPVPQPRTLPLHALAPPPAQYTWLLILMNILGYLFQS